MHYQYWLLFSQVIKKVHKQLYFSQLPETYYPDTKKQDKDKQKLSNRWLQVYSFVLTLGTCDIFIQIVAKMQLKRELVAYKRPQMEGRTLRVIEAGERKVKAAQEYLRTSASKQAHQLLERKQLGGRRIQIIQEFELYFREFMGYLEKGEVYRRLPKLKRQEMKQKRVQ